VVNATRGDTGIERINWYALHSEKEVISVLRQKSKDWIQPGVSSVVILIEIGGILGR
jgi:hypothetical protein